jgi:hypothetical protein
MLVQLQDYIWQQPIVPQKEAKARPCAYDWHQPRYEDQKIREYQQE